jgi:hypothetical protein
MAYWCGNRGSIPHRLERSKYTMVPNLEANTKFANARSGKQAYARTDYLSRSGERVEKLSRAELGIFMCFGF